MSYLSEQGGIKFAAKLIYSKEREMIKAFYIKHKTQHQESFKSCKLINTLEYFALIALSCQVLTKKSIDYAKRKA
ncbi:MAG: hypothetical protein PUF61_01960 [Spirochaetales bacterium]|nr:hypothetical protein [Spirochaetales bacterium]